MSVISMRRLYWRPASLLTKLRQKKSNYNKEMILPSKETGRRAPKKGSKVLKSSILLVSPVDIFQPEEMLQVSPAESVLIFLATSEKVLRPPIKVSFTGMKVFHA
jgi:hypothetical protein